MQKSEVERKSGPESRIWECLIGPLFISVSSTCRGLGTEPALGQRLRPGADSWEAMVISQCKACPTELSPKHPISRNKGLSELAYGYPSGKLFTGLPDFVHSFILTKAEHKPGALLGTLSTRAVRAGEEGGKGFPQNMVPTQYRCGLPACLHAGTPGPIWPAWLLKRAAHC